MDFVKNNAIQIIIGMFFIGGVYARFLIVESDVGILEQRLEKKIKLIKELDDRIHELEKCSH